MLVLSWLFHDTWFIVEYDNNEIYWAKIAKNFLKNIWYNNKKIFIIENIILATIITKKPENILEEIIKDADLDNLWRNDFFEKSQNLKKEIEKIKNIKLDKISWNTSVLELIKNYSYYTKTQKKEREEKKLENIKILENKIL
jgi:predicted metal-dependent HD superfamily phosphohydrolase